MDGFTNDRAAGHRRCRTYHRSVTKRLSIGTGVSVFVVLAGLALGLSDTLRNETVARAILFVGLLFLVVCLIVGAWRNVEPRVSARRQAQIESAQPPPSWGSRAELLHRPLRSLSGGQAARAGLAALRTARFDAVLLDEPTNHLDADGLARLAALLRERDGGVVIVSHDRALLSEAVDELVELDPRTGRATAYAGGWEAYERERDGARRRAQDEHDRALRRRAQLVKAERETRRVTARLERRHTTTTSSRRSGCACEPTGWLAAPASSRGGRSGSRYRTNRGKTAGCAWS